MEYKTIEVFFSIMISLFAFGAFHGTDFLSSALLVSVGKHVRNTLKDTTVPAVPAIRTGQDLYQLCVSIGPDPDGWETLKCDYMIWNKVVSIAARLLQGTMSIHLISPNPDNNNLKSEYRKEINRLLNGRIGIDLCRY